MKSDAMRSNGLRKDFSALDVAAAEHPEPKPFLVSGFAAALSGAEAPAMSDFKPFVGASLAAAATFLVCRTSTPDSSDASLAWLPSVVLRLLP